MNTDVPMENKQDLIKRLVAGLTSRWPLVDWDDAIDKILEESMAKKVEEIDRKILECKETINQAHLEIKRIQDEDCPHFNMKEVYKADTGNWSASDDSYWKEVWCEDCGKTATYDSNEPGYKEKGFYNEQK